MTIPIIYVAGPFRASTAWLIQQNVRKAEALGLEVAAAGAMPLIPHKNTEHFHGMLDDAFWLAGTLELLRRCDAMILVDGWEGSIGTRAEVNEAVALRKPVFYSIAELIQWLELPAS